MKKRVANIIVEQIASLGVDYIFGVTGKAISPFIDAILDYQSIKFISAKHESGGALMAYGYAQGSGKIGVCCGTTGGGTTNLATGVATAYMNSVPLLVITGQISTFEFGKGAFQESTGIGQSINSVEFFKSFTKETLCIEKPENAIALIQCAIKTATSGRMGPVHINIPFDIQLTEIIYQAADGIIKPEIKQHDYDHDVVQAIRMIREAKNPIFLLGWGSVISGANIEIIEIAEALNIPVVTTHQGKGSIPSNHRLCLGIMGICGHSAASTYVFEKADLIIAVGTSFGEFSTFNWDKRITENKSIIQIDIDPNEIGKNFPVRLGIIGDAKHISEDILRKVKESEMPLDVEQKEDFGVQKQNMFIDAFKMGDRSIPLKPQWIMKEIRDNTPDSTLFLADSGSHWAWAMHYLPIHHGGGFYPTLSLGSMGASICAAIGLKLAKPENTVVCICGDGSFLMYGNEVTTAEQYNIAVIWVILNDAKYNLPALSMQKQYNRTVGVDFRKTDFAKLADVFGIKGYRIEKPDDLGLALFDAVHGKWPAIIDAHIDPDEMPPVGKRKLNP